jgi:hypothetical protein
MVLGSFGSFLAINQTHIQAVFNPFDVETLGFYGKQPVPSTPNGTGTIILALSFSQWTDQDQSIPKHSSPRTMGIQQYVFVK